MNLTVGTLAATIIHNKHATLNGDLTFTLSYPEEWPYVNASYFFQWKKGLDGEIQESSHFFGLYPVGVGHCSFLAASLDPGYLYYFRCGGQIQGESVIWGGWKSFTTVAIAITTLAATEIHSTSAILNGSFAILDQMGPVIYIFEWKKGVSGEVYQFYSSGGTYPPGFCSRNYSNEGLDPDSVYYFRFGLTTVGSEGWYEVWGEWKNFITSALSFAITYDATEVHNLISTLNGETVLGGDGPILESGFEWKKKTDSGVMAQVKVLDGGGELYSLALIGLEIDTLYCFRSYGRVGYFDIPPFNGRMFYGDVFEFTTTEIVPVVSTQIATDLEAISALGNGTIISVGGEEPYCNKRGFDVNYSFAGTLEEYEVWKSHGFTGDVILNTGTGLWEGTLTKSYEESGTFSTGAFTLGLDDLICDKEYLYRARAKNTAGWGHGSYLAFTTNDLLLRKSCTCGIFTIMLCAYVKPIPSGSVIKRRGFRWGKLISAEEYDIHEDGNFPASATIGPVDTISFVKSNDDNVYDTIVDSSGGFLTAGFVAGKFINVSAAGVIDPVNEGKFKIISVIAGTITVNVRNTLVSEAVTGVTIIDLFALYIVDLDPETIYYSVAYIAIEDNLGVWTMQEGNVVGTTTIANVFDFEGYDKVEFYKPEREQNYKKITRKIGAEIIAEQYYIDKVGGRRVLDIPNHLIQTKEKAVEIGTNYKNRFQEIKSLMGIEFPTPAPFQREDTLDIGFGRIRFKENDKGVVNFMPDGEGLMLFRYRMVMLIRKTDMNYTISKDNVDYMATMELEEA